MVWKDNCTNLQHLSQKNLSSAFSVSVELKFLRQLVIELFCSISRLRSRNVSSLAVTVSHRRHLVSFVKVPWNYVVYWCHAQEQFVHTRSLPPEATSGRR